MNIEEAKAAPATRLALHPDGTPMVSIGQAAPLAELGRLAADPEHSRSVMGPAPEPAPEGLTDEELLELMPQQFRDDLATVSRLASYGTPVEPGIYRVSLNTGSLDFARAVEAAVLARRPTPQPPADSELTVNLRMDLSSECLKRLCDGLAAAVKPNGGYRALTTDDDISGEFIGEQQVGVEWWLPEHGVDSLENTLDSIKGRLLAAVRDWLPTAMTPAPQPPADGEVEELVAWLNQEAAEQHPGYSDALPDGVRDCLLNAYARLTRAAELLQRQHPQPVAVSERLPGPEDCDAEGRCWLLTVEDEYPQWRLHSIEGAQPGGAMIWVPVDSSPGVMVDCFYTSHWLPFHALPVPTSEGVGE